MDRSQPLAREECEAVARDLLRVYETDDDAALQRLGRYYERAVTREELRARVWQRLESVRHSRRLTLEDARSLLAREAGFGNWSAFTEAKASGRPASAETYAIDATSGTIRPRRELTDEEWDALLAVMRERGIQALDAQGQMTDALLERVARLSHVTTLELGGSNRLGDEGLRHLARMPQLEALDLSNYPGGPLSDRGLQVLRELPALRRFALCWQPGVSDAGIAHLAASERLEDVNLMGTRTGDGALRALAGKPGLRKLRTGRLVSDAGLPLLHQFPVFKAWRGGEIRYQLLNPDAEPNQLLLDGPFTDRGLGALAGLDGIFGLGFFWHCSEMTPSGLAPLASLPNLGMLNCGGELCDDGAMRTIAAVSRLRMLVAQGTVATDAGFEALSRSASLEYLWGRECPNLTGRGFAALAGLTTLRGLAVSCKNVDDLSLSALPGFPSLAELLPMDVPDAGFRHVGRCEKLEALWFMYCRETTDAATEHIAGLKRLRTYYAGKTRITDRSLELLGGMSSLEKLEFWETAGVTDAGLPALARLPRLREVAFHGVPGVTLGGTAVFPPAVKVDHSA
jgi:hypothetical protein